MDKLFEWLIAYRNLFRNKWRTFATMMAIIIGFSGLCLLGEYIIRLEAYLRVNTIFINQLGHMSIYKKGGVDLFSREPEKYQLTPETLAKIYSVFKEKEFSNEIDFTGEYLTGQGLISNGDISQPFLAKGIDPEVNAKIFNHPSVLKWTNEFSLNEQGLDFLSAIKENKNTISVTKELGNLIGLETPFPKQEIIKREVTLAGKSIYGDLNAVNGFVTLQHTTGSSLAEDTSLIAPIKLLKQLYGLEGVTNVAVYLKDNSSSVASVSDKLTKRFNDLKIDTEVIPYYDERIGQFYSGTMSFFYIMSAFFVLLICSAVTISIINAMTMGILERTKEIGTMRSLGISIKMIARIFMKEAILMTIVGIIIGTILSQIIAMLIAALNIRFFPPGVAGSIQFVLTPELWFCALMGVLMLIISATTGYFVSKRSANLKIIELLTDAGR